MVRQVRLCFDLRGGSTLGQSSQNTGRELLGKVGYGCAEQSSHLGTKNWGIYGEQ